MKVTTSQSWERNLPKSGMIDTYLNSLYLKFVLGALLPLFLVVGI